jgi:hypothetical protein
MEKGCCKEGPCPKPCEKGPCEQVCPKKFKKKMKCKAMCFIKQLVLLMCPEWTDEYREVMTVICFKMMKMCCPTMGKGPCPKEAECAKKCPKEKGECPIKCMAMKMVKKFLGCAKEKLKGRLDIGFASLTKVVGQQNTFHPKLRRVIIKSMAKLMYLYHMQCDGGCKKKPCDPCKEKCKEECKGKEECKEKCCKMEETVPKETLEKIADDFFTEAMYKKFGKFKKKAKKIAKMAVCMLYDVDCCICRKVLTKRVKLKLQNKMICMEENQLEEMKKKQEAKEGPCPMMGMCGGRGGWMQKMMKCCERKELLKFAAAIITERGYKVKECVTVVAEAVKSVFKDKKCDEACMNKCIAKISSKVLEFHCEDFNKEEAAKFAVKYCKEICTCCGKDCWKRCKKTFEVICRISGMRDDRVICMASRWGAYMCCHVNGPTGCKEDDVVSFASKWVKDNGPIVAEAMKLNTQIVEEFYKGKMVGSFRRYHVIGRKMLWYLRWYAGGAKFDKDDFVKYCKRYAEKQKLFCEKEGKMPCPFTCQKK